MIQFSIPMYEMIVKELFEQQDIGIENVEEKVVEIQWKEYEMLFRFTPCLEADKVGFKFSRMDTFRAGVLVSNDFNADRLRRML